MLRAEGNSGIGRWVLEATCGKWTKDPAILRGPKPRQAGLARKLLRSRWLSASVTDWEDGENWKKRVDNSWLVWYKSSAKRRITVRDLS
jgi:hypothetical protein